MINFMLRAATALTVTVVFGVLVAKRSYEDWKAVR
jgi:hypothetical protein